MRDLTHEPDDIVVTERSRVGSQGWGRALLDRQAPQGWWVRSDDEGWMATTDALVLLRAMGLDPFSADAARAIARVKAHLRFETLANRPYFEGETEPCINGAILAVGSYFGERCDRIADRVLDEQLADGGWNCDAPPSTRSSFNSTIRVLEGLLEYERTWGITTAITDARHQAHEYLLERRMFRRLTTGESVDRKWTRFAFPTVWHYDVLRGRASRWNTMRAMRVLQWYDRAQDSMPPATENLDAESAGVTTVHHRRQAARLTRRSG